MCSMVVRTSMAEAEAVAVAVPMNTKGEHKVEALEQAGAKEVEECETC